MTAGTSELSDIRQELMIHARWLTRRTGRPGNLGFRDLSGLTLGRMRLSGVSLIGANLCRSDLSGADLSQAVLFGADLEDATLTGARLTGADLRGANLNRTVMTECCLKGADLRAGGTAMIRGATRATGAAVLTDSRLERAVMTDAWLSGCDLSGADLTDADLTGADLTDAVLIGAELAGATVDQARLGNTLVETARLSPPQRHRLGTKGGITEPPYKPIDNGELASQVAAHGAWIATAGSQGARLVLEGREITGARLVGHDLSGARLRRCRFVASDLSGARLDMADLSFSDLRDAVLEQASLRGTNLRRTLLDRVQAAAAVFDAMDLAGGRRWPANLEGARLFDADLTNASFSNAVLNRADLGGAILAGASLRGVALGSVKRSAVRREPGHSPCERRRMRRFTRPALCAETAVGGFVTRDWSFGGLNVEWAAPGAPPPAPGQSVGGRLAANGGPAVAFAAEVTRIEPDPVRPRVALRFVAPDEALTAFLNTHIPAKYQRR